MRCLIFVIFVFSFSVGQAANTCLDTVKAIADETEVNIQSIYNENISQYDEDTFNACIGWVTERATYEAKQAEAGDTELCGSKSAEWKAILKHLKRNVRSKFKAACDKDAAGTKCSKGCPKVLTSVMAGGLPELLKRVNALYSE